MQSTSLIQISSIYTHSLVCTCLCVCVCAHARIPRRACRWIGTHM